LAEVGHCITLPAFRSTGLGLSLMREAFYFCVARLHATHILVDYFIDNVASVKFHRAIGFRPLGQPYRDARFTDSPESIVGILAVEEMSKRRGQASIGHASTQALTLGGSELA
jgi:RimJ/RimL family protein N-acetyltransferase